MQGYAIFEKTVSKARSRIRIHESQQEFDANIYRLAEILARN